MSGRSGEGESSNLHRHRRSNGDGTVVLRKDGRWQGAVYVLTSDGTVRRKFVYGKTGAEATR